MINDIKLDSMMPGFNQKKTELPVRESQNSSQKEDVTISNHLNTLVNLMAGADDVPDDSARVMQMKQQIEKNNYHVDFDALSEKLVHQLFSKNKGI
jgi:anti-sigma28 factor (negative regulator of flagellin synthesis)